MRKGPKRRDITAVKYWWQGVNREKFEFNLSFGRNFYDEKEYEFSDEKEFSDALKFHGVEDSWYYRRQAQYSGITQERRAEIDAEYRAHQNKQNSEAAKRAGKILKFANNPHQRVCRTCLKEMTVQNWSDNPCCGPMVAIDPSDPETCNYDKVVAFVKKQQEARS